MLFECKNWHSVRECCTKFSDHTTKRKNDYSMLNTYCHQFEYNIQHIPAHCVSLIGFKIYGKVGREHTHMYLRFRLPVIFVFFVCTTYKECFVF